MKTLQKHPFYGNDLETYLPYFLKKLQHINAVPPAAWDRLRPCMELVSCIKGHPLRNRPGDFYFVCKGLLKEEYDQHGKLTITRFIKEDDPLFITLNSYQGFLIAVEDCTLLRLSRENYLALRTHFPIIGMRFDELMEEWYEVLNLRIGLIALPIKNRFSAFKRAFPRLSTRILKKDIARYLEINSTYFSEIQ
ncbi:hypothetical protein SAMN05216436_1321 [bacterium A37T11]|nr:hypothetical protein SAMN05216436_1321 [bacterium A37T11]